MLLGINKISNEKSISISLCGGLGNQMFQYALGRTLADLNHCQLILDVSSFVEKKHNVTPRNFLLDNYNIRVDDYNYSKQHSSLKLSIFRKIPLFEKISNILIQKNRGYQKDIFSNRVLGKYLHGYWQSHYYFLNNSKNIFLDYQIKKILSAEALKILSIIKSCNSVMLHVRRGDYISSKIASNILHSLSINYYIRAYERSFVTLSKPVFFIFSDDVEWCRQNFDFIKEPIYFIGDNNLIDDCETLELMSHCRHHIIANSTFSWWSAWLADQRYGISQRLILAPSIWLKDIHIEYDELYLKHWNQINDL